jgi:CRISPR-associated protein (TIGR03986 family)
MTLPKQTTDFASDRVASAPYNFVPLPEKVVAAATDPKELPRHDRYDPGRLSGYFDVHLTTRSPLYVRGALPLEDFRRAGEEEMAESPVCDMRKEQRKKGETVDATFRDLARNTPAFFYQSDPEHPVIPGSSLRGMLRFYLSIISYGKLQPVSERRVFHRDFEPSTETQVGRRYGDRVVGNAQTGFLQEHDGEYRIQPCDYAKVPRRVVDSAIEDNDVPSWDESNKYHQHQTVGVRRRKRDWRIEPEPSEGQRRGCLAVSGPMGRKKEHIFLFPESLEQSNPVSVDESLIRDFNREEQLTQFQKNAYPKDEPFDGAREGNGMLQNDLQPRPEDDYYGEPVHFVTKENGEEADFFGRAQLFRVPYEHSPRESLPRAHSDASIYDYAEALFGFVRTGDVHEDFRDRGGTEDEWEKRAEHYEQGGRGRAYAGRVTVTPAATVPGQGEVRAGRAIVPKILSTPEPTTVQHYLVQTSDRKENIKTYDDAGGYDNTCEDGPDPDTALRGHKLYWHQGRVSPGKVKADSEDLEPDDSQHTYVRPVTPETRFRFRVRFDNLSKAELGALCWALRPEGDPDVMHQTHAVEDAPDLSEKELPKTGYFHKLGMGRPLGLGSVQLDARLHLTDRTGRTDRTDRYRALFAEMSDSGECRWHDATRRATEEERARFRDNFEKDLRGQLDGEGWWTGGPGAPLREQCRIQDLLTLMRWPGVPSKEPTSDDPKRYLREEQRPNTRYMQIELNGYEDEFEERPVLPSPATLDDQRPSLAVVTLSLNPTQAAGTGERVLGRVEHYKDGEGYITNPNGSNLRFESNDIGKHSGSIQEEALVSFFVTGRGDPKRVYRETNASARELMQDASTADPAPGAGPRQPAPSVAKPGDKRGDASSPQQRSFDERQTGTVKFFDSEEGWGFIVPDPGCVCPDADADNDDVFVHVSDIPGDDLPEDEPVEYNVRETKKGLNAKNVALVR